MNILCTIAGAACLGYYAALVIYSGPDTSFAWFWLLAGGLLLVSGWVFFLTAGMGGWEKGLRLAIVAFLGISFFLLLWEGIHVVSCKKLEDPENVDFVIVLGAKVNGTVPSKSLTRRLQKALSYAVEHPETKLILSGGKGPGEDISEAACMKSYLTANGIPEDRLILEENSTSTAENLAFSDSLTSCSQVPCGILTNDFHIYRSLYLAEKGGYTQALGIPASSDPLMLPHFIVRECAAMLALRVS